MMEIILPKIIFPFPFEPLTVEFHLRGIMVTQIQLVSSITLKNLKGQTKEILILFMKNNLIPAE